MQKSTLLEWEANEDFTIEANPTLIEILASNLLSNAIRHNLPNGRIQMSLKNREWKIRNSGKTGPLDTQKLFQRFQKESNDSSSLGLGLEIAKKICDLYHYQLQYQFLDPFHSFSVRF